MTLIPTGPMRLMTCRSCGSDQVLRDAWASWSLEDQQWQLGEVFDHAFCMACETDCDITETESEAPPTFGEPIPQAQSNA